MRYLPDTNVMIALMFGREPIYSRFRHMPVGEFGLSSVVQFELFFGAMNRDRREKSLAALEKLRFETVPFEEHDAFRAGEIRAALKALGTPIGPYDVLIAGQALARDLTLVSRNIREFSRVDGLRVEN